MPKRPRRQEPGPRRHHYPGPVGSRSSRGTQPRGRPPLSLHSPALARIIEGPAPEGKPGDSRAAAPRRVCGDGTRGCRDRSAARVPPPRASPQVTHPQRTPGAGPRRRMLRPFAQEPRKAAAQEPATEVALQLLRACFGIRTGILAHLVLWLLIPNESVPEAARSAVVSADDAVPSRSHLALTT